VLAKPQGGGTPPALEVQMAFKKEGQPYARFRCAELPEQVIDLHFFSYFCRVTKGPLTRKKWEAFLVRKGDREIVQRFVCVFGRMPLVWRRRKNAAHSFGFTYSAQYTALCVESPASLSSPRAAKKMTL
jgi:hypothetical protein